MVTNLFYLPLNFQGYCFKLLFDTGAFSSPLSKTILQTITQNKPACVTKLPNNFPERVYVADGKKIRVLGKVFIELNVGLNTYSEEFLVLDQMSTATLGNLFIIKNQIVIDPSKKLPFSRYSSPVFGQRKSSGKLRILIDLRRTNNLLRHDYNNNNYSIPTMTDATAHPAGKTIFAKMDCSQAYFSMQMADSLSVQLLAFNFGDRNFAFRRLAQVLSRSPTAFSSCVSKHLQSCVASDKCFVYFDDLGSVAKDGNTLVDNLEQICCCIQNLDFKLSIEKC